ncbi:ABC transporter substrate-binding protein [Roseomonas sp. NAR14]|uniref:ABC transporter substrate-binding protein n=1 Tax=Roseomonas acroporae TaxID=2937791 RepID=A0A9X2BW89_9PROT|nr:ABC transporter substrate-binding protein [Roseomonas acroporae]MCK8783615.1 ABC transporter substrate-binding protein [Roseomonas acroporae]
MQRRDFLKSAAGGIGLSGLAGSLARPALAQAPGSRVLKFIPQSDLTVMDPVVTTAYVTRHHALMIWDQLYGVDADFKPQPQMAEGHTVEDDGKRVTIRLREGLKFHDGHPVRARDAVASIKRWAQRDAMGQALMAATDELSAPDDRSILFRLKKPFPMLFYALGKPGTPILVVMPERLAQGDPSRQVTEMIGSGPFKWVAGERVPGSRLVYERNADYVPRADGPVAWTSGPKKVNFDRVEWQVIPDQATAAAALQNGEVDWWEQPTNDFAPTLQRNRNLVFEVSDPTGFLSLARFNHLHPPFDKPAVRRALLGALVQADYMTAVMGDDRSQWRDKVGYFPPETPMASDAGLDALTSPRDIEKVKRDLTAAGYKGEKIVMLGSTDQPALYQLAQVGADYFKRAGMNVDFVTTDWGSVVQRRANKASPEQGGWSVFFTNFTGLDFLNPGTHLGLRGNGQNAWFGWPTMPRIEELRGQWLDATAEADQKKIAAEIQAQAFQEVPYLPLGQYFQSWSYKRNLTRVLKGMPMFWNAQRAS